jgi:exosortase
MQEIANLADRYMSRVRAWGTIACFVVLSFLLVVFFRHPLATLISLGLGSTPDASEYSQIAVSPLICLYLILRKRKAVFTNSKISLLPGVAVMLAGVAILVVAWLEQRALGDHGYITGLMLAFVTLEIGNFLLFFGPEAFRRGHFALLTLILMIPFPTGFLDRTVSLLQQGSASVTAMLLNLTPMPFVREGLVFHLPTNLNIVIAQECSGIRSSIALLIASLVASDVFLRKGWSKLALNLAVLPLSLFKNGVRIATLSVLSVYVDRGFMFGDLHHKGGIVFYLIACAVLTIFLWSLWKFERRHELAAPLRRSVDLPLETSAVSQREANSFR